MTDDTTDRKFSNVCDQDLQTTDETPRSPSSEQTQKAGTVSYIFENLVECIYFV